MDRSLKAPGTLTIKDNQVHGQIRVVFEGREVGDTLWERIRTAWYVLTGQARKLYAANTHIMGCNVTSSPEHKYDVAIRIG
jgi:hypothetical protein